MIFSTIKINNKEENKWHITRYTDLNMLFLMFIMTLQKDKINNKENLKIKLLNNNKKKISIKLSLKNKPKTYNSKNQTRKKKQKMSPSHSQILYLIIYLISNLRKRKIKTIKKKLRLKSSHYKFLFLL